jgi:hypothetical protein
MTLESFLAWEERQELRYEFDGSRRIARTGGTYAHAQIQFRLVRALVNRLGDGPCKAVGGLKVRTANGVRYPDAFIICSPIPLNATLAHDPVVIFEISSPSTGNDDLGAKKLEYQALPSPPSPRRRPNSPTSGANTAGVWARPRSQYTRPKSTVRPSIASGLAAFPKPMRTACAPGCKRAAATVSWRGTTDPDARFQRCSPQNAPGPSDTSRWNLDLVRPFGDARRDLRRRAKACEP